MCSWGLIFACKLLTSSSAEVHQQAAAVLANVANGSQQNRAVVCESGVLPWLAMLLTSSRSTVQQQAAAVLAMLLTSGHPDIQEHLADVLANLARCSQRNVDAICAAGAVPLLLDFLRSGHAGVQTTAALATLAVGSQQTSSTCTG